MGVHRADGTLRWFDVTAQPLAGLDRARPRGVVASFVDITERKEAEAALAAREAHFRALVEHNTDAVLLTVPDGRILSANPAACRMFGYTEDELCRLGRAGIVDTDDPRLPVFLAERERNGYAHGELGYIRRDGSRFPGEVSSTIFRAQDGSVRTSMVIRDITDRKRAEVAVRESEERFRRSFDHAAIGMALVAPTGQFLRVNRALCAFLGYDEATLLVTNSQALTHPDDLDSDREMIRALLAGEIVDYRVEKRYRHRDGHYVWGLLGVSLVRDEAGAPLHFVSQIQDIDDRKRAEDALRASEARLAYLAAHDPLTGLSNRRHFGEVVGAALARQRRGGPPIALLYLDLDGFKAVNDRYGHEAGDYLLGEMADRLRACVRTGDTPARLGGDEFAVLLEGASEGDARVVAERITVSLAVPVRIGAATARVTASVGAALAAAGETTDDLLRRADGCLYAAKRAGKDQVVLAAD